MVICHELNPDGTECGKKACFGDGVSRRVCGRHNIKKLPNLTIAKCACGKNAYFGGRGRNATHCRECAKGLNLKNPHKKMCEKCGKTRANFDNNKHCHGCATDKTNINRARCLEPTDDGPCQITPSYGFPNDRRTKCVQHSKKYPGMVSFGGTICTETNDDGTKCTIRASYGMPGGKRVTCAAHIKEDMVDLSRRNCKHDGCKHTAKYGVPGRPPTHCKDHADKNTMSKIYGKCKHPGCEISASFGLPNGKPMYCGLHQDKKTMVLLYCRDCEEPDCDVQPCYAMLGEKARRCAEHRLDGMVDVVNEHCDEAGCDTLANFGVLYGKKIHCTSHSTPNEMHKNNPRCEKCPKGIKANRPFWTDDGSNIPKRCINHKLDTDTEIKLLQCTECNGQFYIRSGSTKCASCEGYAPPLFVKEREKEVENALVSAKIPVSSANKRIDGGSTRKRPDFIIEHPQFRLIVECDEYQHRRYTKEDELDRMYKIATQDSKDKDCMFLRYNPDFYYDNNGIPHRYDPQRVLNLIDQIQKIMNQRASMGKIVVIYMYYNGYDGVPLVHQLVQQNNKIVLM